MENIFREPSAKERESRKAYDVLYAKLKKEQAERVVAGISQSQQPWTSIASTSSSHVSLDDRLSGSNKRLQTPLTSCSKRQCQSVNSLLSADDAEEGSETEAGQEQLSTADFSFDYLSDMSQPYEDKRKMFLRMKAHFETTPRNAMTNWTTPSRQTC